MVFLCNGVTKPARKVAGSKMAECEYPSANFYNGFDRKIKGSDLFPCIIIKLRDVPSNNEKNNNRKTN